MEAEQLDAAQRMDERYHLAKLIAAAFAEPERIWREHEEARAALLRPTAPAPQMSDQAFMDAVARIHKKLQGAGLVKPTSGVMN